MAAAEGFLALAGNCLVLSGGCGSTHAPVLPVFCEAEVGWDGESLAYEGRRYRVGDRIVLGGGRMDLTELTGLTLPDGCSVLPSFVVA